jgi:hypothetical protein
MDDSFQQHLQKLTSTMSPTLKLAFLVALRLDLLRDSDMVDIVLFSNRAGDGCSAVLQQKTSLKAHPY